MCRIPTNDFSHSRAFGHCVDELLWHKSRYYRYAEQFLAELAGCPGFCMASYDPRALSHDQRQVLSGLLREQPTSAIGHSVIEIVSSVIHGETKVDAALLERYSKAGRAASPYLKAGAFVNGRSETDETISPVEPLQNMALRLGIPVRVKGDEVKVPKRILARHLDSPNPVVRQNLQACILRLKEGGYRLVNDHHRPPRKFEWEQDERLPASTVVWRLLLRWTHLQKKNSEHPIFSRSA